jgi:hypothetical protein
VPTEIEALTKRVALVEDDMIAMKDQHKEFRSALDANTRTTNEIKTDTASMLEMFQSWQGAFKTLEMIGKLFKPLGYIAVAISAVAATWASLKGVGITPK